MKKYKLDKNVQVPKEKEISSRKDFAKLKANYDQLTKPIYRKPLYKDPKTFLALLVILLIAWLIANNTAKKKERNQPVKMEQNPN